MMQRDWTVAPGDTLRDWMDENATPMRVAARACGLELATFERLLDGTEPLTTSIAVALESGTGITAAFWLGFEANYRADLRAGRTRFP